MLSILPKHVADEMLKDMKKDESQKDQQQFNTMYMYRHENVRCARRTGSESRTGGALWAQLSAADGGLPWDQEQSHPRGVSPGVSGPADGVGAETRFGLAGPAPWWYQHHQSQEVASVGPPSIQAGTGAPAFLLGQAGGSLGRAHRGGPTG